VDLIESGIIQQPEKEPLFPIGETRT